MAVESTEFNVKFTGGDEVSQGFRKVAEAATEAGKATGTAGDKIDDAGKKSAEGGPKIQQLAGVMGQVGGAVGQTNTHLASMISAMGQATNVVGSLSATMGPLGVAIGVATTAWSLYQRATADATNEMADHAIPTIDSMISKIQDLQRELDREDRINRGEGTGLEYQARVDREVQYQEQVRHRIALLDDQIARQETINTLIGNPRTRADLDRLNHEYARQNAELARSERALQSINRLSLQAANREAEQAFVGPDAGPAPGSGGVSQADLEDDARRRRRGRGDAGTAEQNAKERLLATLGKPTGEPQGAQFDAEMDEQRKLAQAQKTDDEARAARLHTLNQQRIAAEREYARVQGEVHRAHMADLENEIKKRQEIADVTITSLGIIGDLAGTVAKNEQEGTRIKAGFEGAMEIVKAAVDEAAAISYFADFNYVSGAAKQASAIAHGVAAGKAFAIAGGAGQSAGGGGAAGSGGGAAPAHGPRPDTSAGSGGGGITVQILGPMVAAHSQTEVGRILGETLRSAITRRGVRYVNGVPLPA